jgi:hypothetical protein
VVGDEQERSAPRHMLETAHPCTTPPERRHEQAGDEGVERLALRAYYAGVGAAVTAAASGSRPVAGGSSAK